MSRVHWAAGVDVDGNGAGPVNPAQQVQGFTMNTEGIKICFTQDMETIQEAIKGLERQLSRLSVRCNVAQKQAAVRDNSRKDLIRPETRARIHEVKECVDANYNAMCNLISGAEHLLVQHEENMRLQNPAAPAPGEQ